VAAAGLVVLLIVLQRPVISTPLFVAFWCMVAGVVAAEMIAQRAVKPYLARSRGVGIAIDILFALVAAVAGYVFAVHVHPGMD
jgi:hypothetical protein